LGVQEFDQWLKSDFSGESLAVSFRLPGKGVLLFRVLFPGVRLGLTVWVEAVGIEAEHFLVRLLVCKPFLAEVESHFHCATPKTSGQWLILHLRGKQRFVEQHSLGLLGLGFGNHVFVGF